MKWLFGTKGLPRHYKGLIMKRISIVTPCFNEEENVAAVYERVKAVFTARPQYTYEHIFIDNASTDQTVAILKSLAAADPAVKIIVNARNFGHIRSPYHAILQTTGDAVILLVSDLQDPPEMIGDFLARWEEGYRVVLGVKVEAEESALFFAVRRFYYKLVARLADVRLTENNTGFGLFDRTVVQILRQLDDPYPYFRGLIADIGFESFKIPYKQPKRKRGFTKNNLYTLYDIAMLGITNHSKVPLRMLTLGGFTMSALSILTALGYLTAKLVFWDAFSVGIAPLLIGMFAFSSVQLFFMGILGEYIGFIHTYVMKRPLVIEKERINFDPPAELAAPVPQRKTA
jgi:polyisoprenyl-phosphate glycosyltransferase